MLYHGNGFIAPAALFAVVLVCCLPVHAQPQRGLPARSDETTSLMAQAGGLLMQHTPASLQAGLDRYQAALKLLQAQHDMSGQVQALTGVATAHFLLGQPALSSADLAQADAIAKTGGNQADQAGVKLAFANLHGATGDLRKAQAEAASAAGIFGALGQRDAEAQAWLSAALLDSKLHDAARAVGKSERSLVLFRATGNRAGIVQALIWTGLYNNQLRTQDSFGKAVRVLEEALPMLEASGNAVGLSIALPALGMAQDGLGQRAAAKDAYERAQKIFSSFGNKQQVAQMLLNMGEDEHLLNHAEAAVQDLEQAVPMFDAAGDTFNLSMALKALGEGDDILHRTGAARDAYARAATLFEARNDRMFTPGILIDLGEDEQTLGHAEIARSDYEKALPLVAASGNAAQHGLVLMKLAALREKLGDHAGALAAYIDAAAAWRAAGNPAMEAMADQTLGEFRAAAGDFQGALDFYAIALKLDEAAGDKTMQATALLDVAGVYQTRGDYQHQLDAATAAVGLLDGPANAWQRAIALLMAGGAASGLHDHVQALQYLDQVIALGDRNLSAKAGALATEGEIATAMSNPRKALGLLQQALDIDQSLHKEGASNTVQNDLGLAYSAMGRRQEALKQFEMALAAAQAQRNIEAQAASLSNIAQVHQAFGDARQAVGFYLRSQAKAHEAGNRALEAGTLSNLAMAYDALGDDAKAIDTLKIALSLHKDVGDSHGEATTLSNMGLIYKTIGEPQRALDLFSQAKDMFANHAEPDDESSMLDNIGSVYSALGATDRARDYYTRAAAIDERTKDDQARAVKLNNLAVLELDPIKGNPEHALDLFQEAMRIALSSGDLPKQGIVYGGMAEAKSEMADHAEAVRLLTKALEIARQTGNTESEAYAVHNLGFEYEQMDKPVEALAQMRLALATWGRVGSLQGQATASYVIAHIEFDQGALEGSLNDVDRAIRLSESLRSRVSNGDLRATLFAQGAGAYALKTQLLMQLSAAHPGEGYEAQALETSERGRARSLLDLLAESQAGIRRGIDPALLEQDAGIAHALDAKAAQQAKLSDNGTDRQEFEQLAGEIAQLTVDYEQVQARIRAASPAYAALTQPQPLGLKQIQALLDPDTLLLEYALCHDHSYVFAVTQTTLHAYKLPGADDVKFAARAFRDEVTHPHGYRDAATEVGKMLLGPVASELGAKRLVIVADAELQSDVPFAALPSPGALAGPDRPLVMDHDIVTEPSASALAVVRQGLAGRPHPTGTVAILADPVVSDDDPRLPAARKMITDKALPDKPFSILRVASADVSRGGALERLPNTAEEARQILALAGPSQTLSRLGFDASKSAAQDPQLGRFRIVHFATHGFLDPLRPELSGLVFSLYGADGTPQDGFLRLADVFNLSLPVDTVVLSACESGQGQKVSGEGLLGLTRGFFYAGASSLVVSLWDVQDDATSYLMAQFYARMLQAPYLTPAAALRQAQIAMLRSGKWSSPNYWAAFVAEGEWR